MSDFPNMMAALDAIDDGGSMWTAMIAALGDEPIYRIDFDAFAGWVQRRHRSPVADDAGIIGVLRAEGILYRIWPKEDDDESH